MNALSLSQDYDNDEWDEDEWDEDEWGNDDSCNLPGFTVADRINVRSSQSTNADIVGNLRIHTPVEVYCHNDGTIFDYDGWAWIFYEDFNGERREGYVMSKFLDVFDVDEVPMSAFNEDYELLTPDDDPIFGMLSLSNSGGKITGEIWIKNNDMIESGGNGIIFWLKLEGYDFCGSTFLKPIGDDGYMSDLFNRTPFYDKATGTLMVADMLWR